MEDYDHLTLDDGSPLTDREKWVLEQVKRGQVADLKKKFGEKKEDRVLRANFLEKLLTDDFKDYQPHRRGIRVANAVIPDFLDLEDAQVSYITDLDTCTFREEVNFQDSYFTRHLFLNDSTFEKRANFHSVRVGINLFCRDSVFQGPVDFVGADIGGQFSANGAKFESKDREANFNGMKVGQNAFFRKAVFQGPVDFGSADIKGQFGADGAKFESQDREANFNGMKVGQDAFFREAVFQGPVDFGGADIKEQFSAKGAKFESQDREANFNGMKVGRSAFFNGVIFQGPVDFTLIKVDGNFRISSLDVQGQQEPTTFHGPIDFVGADIKGQFGADKAEFLHETPANFEGIKVGTSAFFRDVVFQGVIDLNHAGFLDLIINQKTSSPAIPRLNLERTVVQRELIIGNAKIDVFQASHLQVKGPATFENVMMRQSVDLRDSTFQTLNLIKSTWPKDEEKVRLEGLTYNAINAGPGKEDWKKLLAWVKGSRFNTQVYSQLENYFQRCGHRERANQVFISMKDREGEMAPDMGRWLWNRFLKITIGYGRKPWLALLISLIFFGLGIIAFWDSEGMVRKRIHTESGFVISSQISEAPRPRYDPLWYSLDLLLPIDLDMAKHWEPNPERSLAWHYAKFQIIIGWVLIGVLIVAAAGIIK